jgi:hypothetical protein
VETHSSGVIGWRSPSSSTQPEAVPIWWYRTNSALTRYPMGVR